MDLEEPSPAHSGQEAYEKISPPPEAKGLMILSLLRNCGAMMMSFGGSGFQYFTNGVKFKRMVGFHPKEPLMMPTMFHCLCVSRNKPHYHSPRKHYLPERNIFELFSDYRFTISISSN